MDDRTARYPLSIDPLVWLEQEKLLASDGTAGNRFGSSVSLSVDTAVVGAHGDDDNGWSSGSAYVFARDTQGNWRQQQKLLPSDGSGGEEFGWSVSVSGDTALVGPFYDHDNGRYSGSAYVFVRHTQGYWSQQQKLLPGDGAAGDRFGRSLSVSSDTALVGAFADQDNGSFSGSAYVFVRDTQGYWSEQHKLLPSDAAAKDQFGSSVSVSGDTALVGAFGDNENLGSGSYVFVRDTQGHWSQQQKLLPSDGAAHGRFGSSVSVSGNAAIVSGHGASAYVFVRDRQGYWNHQQKLLPSHGAAGDSFGSSVGVSVSVSGDTAIVGAAEDDNRGSAYVFVLEAGAEDDGGCSCRLAGRAGDDTSSWLLTLLLGAAAGLRNRQRRGSHRRRTASRPQSSLDHSKKIPGPPPSRSPALTPTPKAVLGVLEKR